MPPRTGQLDQISQAIGGLQASVEGIEKYIHDKRHDDANVAMKVEALGSRITKDIAAVEGRIEGRIKAMDDRVVVLELARQRDVGGRGVLFAILKSPVLGWLAGAALTVWVLLSGKHP